MYIEAYHYSYDDEIDYVVNSNITLLLVGFIILFVYVALVLGNLNLIEQRVNQLMLLCIAKPEPMKPQNFAESEILFLLRQFCKETQFFVVKT
jgi:hypothetical protein